MLPTVVIITTFYEHTSGYSLIRVVETQIAMLLHLGIMPIVLVREDFQECLDAGVWSENMIDLRKCMPPFTLTNEIGDDFDERVEQVYQVFAEQLIDADVVIAHDLIFQDYYTAHCVAIHQYASSRDDITWLHWIHSVPVDFATGDMRYPLAYRYLPPPGYIVYPNRANVSQVYRRYTLPANSDKVIVDRSSHSIDPLILRNYSPITKDLVRKVNFLCGDVNVVFPSRLSPSKQPDKVIRLLAGVTELGFDARMLILDWQSTGEAFNSYREELLELIDSYDLSGNVFFASMLNSDCSAGAPPEVAIELLDFANVGVFPSMVETYSLVVHEALLAGLAVVLNDSLEIMHELFGDTGMYIEFGSYWKKKEYDNGVQRYYNKMAKRLIKLLQGRHRAAWNKCQVTKMWNPYALSDNFNDLLHLQPRGVE